MRASIARTFMRLGPVHVVVVSASPVLRDSIAAWLRGTKRVRIAKAVASARDLEGQRIECDLVVASGLDGPAELRAIGKLLGWQAGLVALTLGIAPLPAGWVGVRPGASRTHVLDHAVAHPERGIAASGALLSALFVANLAAFAAFLYVPQTGVSFQRAALAYAERYPDVSTWWHVWGSGAPLLAAATWPLLKAASLTGLGPAAFVLLAAITGAVCGIAVLLVARRATAGRIALAVAVLGILPPALWIWPRGGDIGSLAGLAGVLLAVAATATGRLRLPATALAVLVSAFGGYLWVVAAAAAGIASGLGSRRYRRATASGAVLGVLVSTAIALPPILSRGLDGLRPALARPPAISDLAPVAAVAAILAVCLALARARPRRAVVAIAGLVLVAANALALVVPLPEEVGRIPSTGAFGRLAVHPAQALAVVTANPDVPTTGDEVPAEVMLGEDERLATAARLDRLGADRIMAPDRSSAIVFNERDWALLDRDRLLFAAPFVRPVLTAGITTTILLVAEEDDARVFGDAIAEIGAASETLITVWWPRPLEELDLGALREFTMVAVYGRPWINIAAASDLLQRYLDSSGFLLMDVAARPGQQPLGMPEAEVQQRGADEFRTQEDVAEGGTALITAETGWSGRVAALGQAWNFADDPTWELATMLVGGSRVLQFGATRVGVEALAAHMVWSGVDLPRLTAEGDAAAHAQLKRAIEWMLGAATVGVTGNYGRPDGTPCDPEKLEGTCATQLDSETGIATFRSPTSWRVQMKVATTGVLFKERYHPQWRAYTVAEMSVPGQESTTPLLIRQTVDAHMYVTLPPNARTVEFVFERHPLETASRGISAVATFVTMVVSFFLWRRV